MAPAAQPGPGESAAPPSIAPGRRWRFDAEAGAETRAGFAPTALLGPVVTVGLGRDDGVTPRFHAGFSYGTSEALGTFAPARFTLATGELGACALRLRVTAGFSLGPCVQLDVGAANATGLTVAHPAQDTRAWVDAAALADLRVSTGGGSLFLRGALGPSVSITRPTYVFDAPRQVVYSVPALGFYAAAVAGLLLP